VCIQIGSNCIQKYSLISETQTPSVDPLLQLANQGFNLGVLQPVKLLHPAHLGLQNLNGAAEFPDSVVFFDQLRRDVTVDFGL
jgi:hypothetical protein